MAVTSVQKYLAEFLGTFSLLFLGGGAAVFTAGELGNARVILVSFAFGVTVLAMAYVFGDVSGGHFNPAVTLSMAMSRRMPGRDVIPYIVAQLLGGIIGILVVFGITQGTTLPYLPARLGALGSQCYAGSGAPGGCMYSAGSVFLLELIVTFLFILVIQVVTRPEHGTKNLAPLVIGLTLVVGNLLAIPVDGASLNPVRSFAPALVAQYWSGNGWAIQESWLFWVAPILGGLLASVVESMFRPSMPATPPPPPAPSS